jgi:hypothetical protein
MASKTKSKLGSVVSLLTIGSLLAPPAASAVGRTSFLAGQSSSASTFGQEVQGLNGGVTEYFYRRDKDDVLVPVFMLGEVGKPGLYHVPLKSELITLLSIAGGLSPDADHDRIFVRDSRQESPTKIEMSELVGDSRGKTRQFLGNEVIYVEKSEPWISNNTMLVIGFLSGLVGIVVGARALSK